MTRSVDRSQSVEQLENDRWPEPPAGSTSLVTSVHALRRKPVGQLTVEELRRLIGQDVGLEWLLPLAVEILRETAPGQAGGGFYDDDLLTAVVTRSRAVWDREPELALELRDVVTGLTDLSPYVKPEVDAFLASF
ncbi:contact-dependent growth inhibition system immunity protein [Streptomyces sp. GC420]|uniref:contact-dependent growth inhibition system immunity protein n=1 Tax=Streptomyces sp. GC420 TaxID=2697568 RepID=UPI00141518E6|nr:contact-dependent growth inhibition system immunity protein [Streptomyces sp. GC420]NBM20177.1 hypothetical protein [Streptomyces sp. GC420]